MAPYLKGLFAKALVTAHTWLVTFCQSSRKTSEMFLQTWRYTRTWEGEKELFFKNKIIWTVELI